VLGVRDADSAENNSGSKNIVISPVTCALPNRMPGAPKLSGTIPKIRIRPGSYLHSFYKQDVITEEFFCNYEVNPEFEWAIVDAGFVIGARGPQGETRAIESPAHRFFVATLFQPQLSSKAGKPHPIIVEFLRAAMKWKAEKLEDNVLK
jgi:CTP synthase (UTP-ammonia lyase)